MNKTIFLVGILFGVMAIILGAFGAHGLEAVLAGSQLDTFETGVKYQMYHALLLLIVSQLKGISAKYLKTAFYLTVFGVVFFSFSIYFLATNDLTGFDFRAIGFVTPIGGLLMISAWVLLGIGAVRFKSAGND
ncbi:DUF423 domain-containing protein [Lentiprolixibacter aurantiacus]|uniref:DUF423 domain-containing protein n=1 Tax=Lentiprolixibacter aurantiacus TaxID=2993939 RepID=A0AAE3MJW6_9FLAO|nr:DUF423 domain-containing protein [Lentiprolixibacter aurantiacus]MCX2718224.1 DUF423 domain-containing protein [Lentiprolixibacter aurantiacus]